MSTTTTSTIIPPRVSSYAARALLMRGRPRLHHQKVAQKESIPANSGDTIIFRRYEDLTRDTAPLVEAVTPSGQTLSKTDVQASLVQHGTWTPLSDKVQWIVEDRVLNQAVKLLAENASDVMDILHRDVYVAGTVVEYGGTASSRTDLLGVAHKVSTGLLNRIIRTLEAANAKPFTMRVRGGDRENTFGVQEAYWAIISPQIHFTLRELTGFVSPEKYPNGANIMPGEVGSYRNLRFLCTTLAKTYPGAGGTASGDVVATGSDADVHTILAFGTDAVGSIKWNGRSVKTILKSLGSAGVADPLDQRASAAWKSYDAQIRLNEAFMVRGEVTVGDAAP